MVFSSLPGQVHWRSLCEAARGLGLEDKIFFFTGQSEGGEEERGVRKSTVEKSEMPMHEAVFLRTVVTW